MILKYLGFGIFCFFIMWIMQRMAPYLGVLSHPDQRFRKQQRPIPTLGGVSIVICLTLGSVLFSESVKADSGGLPVLGLLAFIGLLDDRYELSVIQKLLAQSFAALIIVISGYKFTIEGHALFGALISLFILVWLQNAFNLIDVCDGLLTSVILIGCIGLELVGSGLDTVPFPTLCLSLIVFLTFNLPPAKMYLGDAGSFVLAGVFYLYMVDHQNGHADFVDMLLLPIPILVISFEFAQLMYRRTKRGRPVYRASGDHFSLLLLRAGWSKWEVLGAASILSSFGVGLFVLAHAGQTEGKFVAFLITGLLIVILITWFNRFQT